MEEAGQGGRRRTTSMVWHRATTFQVILGALPRHIPVSRGHDTPVVTCHMSHRPIVMLPMSCQVSMSMSPHTMGKYDTQIVECPGREVAQ